MPGRPLRVSSWDSPVAAGSAIRCTALSIGDPLNVRIRKDGRWGLLDSYGRSFGRLARSFGPPSGTRCRSAEVFAVVGWSREASDPKYRDAMKCDAWEANVPELVFEPVG